MKVKQCKDTEITLRRKVASGSPSPSSLLCSRQKNLKRKSGVTLVNADCPALELIHCCVKDEYLVKQKAL